MMADLLNLEIIAITICFTLVMSVVGGLAMFCVVKGEQQ